MIEATQYVTAEVMELWRGIKAGGNDPTGIYTRITGCDSLASLVIAAA